MLIAGVVLIACAPLGASETDDRIESAFSKSYAYKVYLKDDAIKTESRDGVVILSGLVNEPSHKYLAQETVAGLPGVLKVDNRLGVKLEGTEESDAWVRAKVRSVLALHRKVSGSRTQVDIKEGVITLRGSATSEAQKNLATDYAEDVKGVSRVTNLMTVNSAPAESDEMAPENVNDLSLSVLVKLALLSHHSTSLVNTKVETLSGIVTISGIAKNMAEKTLVSKLTADISGVKSVVNNMTIAPAVSGGGGTSPRA